MEKLEVPTTDEQLTSVIGEDIVDVRDIQEFEKEQWKKAIEDQTGYKFEDVEENEPTLIHERYFEDYAQELAEDIGAIGKDNQWPLYCIDWERAADDLKMDYTSFEIDGNTYYFRAW